MTVHPSLQEIRSQTLDILRKALGDADSVAYLDFPNHFNAGDLLIYRGSARYFEMLNVSVDYMCATHTYEPETLAARVPTGPLVLHGGGNFGDRYPAYQTFRERVIADHPDRAIVQMPQTIEFRTADALQRAQGIYAAHPDLTLLMRDRDGFDAATELFPQNKVLFCPDAALGADLAPTSATPSDDVVLLKRNDGESLHTEDRIAPLFPRTSPLDWHIGALPNLKWWSSTSAVLALNKIPGIRTAAATYSLTERSFRLVENLVVEGAVDILSAGRVVVTDRLHAAVFGILMGKPVVMVDNANKKLSRIHRDYLHQLPDVHLAESFDDAARIAMSI